MISSSRVQCKERDSYQHREKNKVKTNVNGPSSTNGNKCKIVIWQNSGYDEDWQTERNYWKRNGVYVKEWKISKNSISRRKSLDMDWRLANVVFKSKLRVYKPNKTRATRI